MSGVSPPCSSAWPTGSPSATDAQLGELFKIPEGEIVPVVFGAGCGDMVLELGTIGREYLETVLESFNEMTERSEDMV